jgi:hypothetical protein
MINFNLEVFPQDIRMPNTHTQNLIFIGGLAQMALGQLFVGESQRSTILHEDIPNVFP